MAATIKLTRTSGMEPGCARPLQVYIDGKKSQPIKAGETRSYTVTPGPHRIQVKQDFSASLELKLPTEDGAIHALECGSYVRGWQIVFFLLWTWRVFAPGKLFYLRRKSGR